MRLAEADDVARAVLQLASDDTQNVRAPRSFSTAVPLAHPMALQYSRGAEAAYAS
jgi:hypothetical protein